MAAPIDEFFAARDLLVRLRLRRDEARSQFRWPRLETFNWALEHFDRHLGAILPSGPSGRDYLRIPGRSAPR